MDKKKELVEQIKVVINDLEKNYKSEIKKGVLQLIYNRYKNALGILENEKDIKEINILGGIRGYLDSYSDHDNHLLGELHKAEKLFKELIKF